MNNSKLILFTSTFPYGTGESFLESETLYYHNFSEVIFIPVSATTEDKKIVRNIYLSNYRIISINGDQLKGKRMLKALCKTFTSKLFYQDIRRAFKLKGFQGIFDLLSFTAVGEERVEQLLAQLNKIKSSNSIFENSVVYAYWLHLPAYVALRTVKSHKKIMSRCHRFDLYEDRSGGYIPYRNFLLNGLSQIFCISENGMKYLKEMYPLFEDKYVLSRLGTCNHGIEEKKDEGRFHIVSCSRLVEVKRVDKIIKALELIADEKIIWSHIGDGPLRNEIEELAKQKIGQSKIHYEFVGEKSNSDVIKMYGCHYYDCFINVSSSEGVPVSIMEAMSFGIPIIATDVGGTSEIVKNKENGFLLNQEFKEQELADAIVRLKNMINTKEYYEYRQRSRQIWSSMCDADKNFSSFVKKLK